MTSRLVRRLAGVALVLPLAACGPGAAPKEPGTAPTATSAGWERVEGFPLSPRTDPVVAWTGSEVIVVGGNTGWVCPPHADCTSPTELASDGAAYDPATRSWRSLEPAPVGLWNSWGGGWDSALVGDVLVVRGTKNATWQGYDVAGDTWSTLTPPAGFDGQLSASGGRLWALSDHRIMSWDPATDDVRVEASYTPARPLQDAQLFVTPAGPVLSGSRYHDVAPDEPTLTQVDVPDAAGGWRRFVTGQVGWLSHWDGARLVGVEPGEVDGGEVNGWDRAYPCAGTLDPVTGDWQPLDVPTRDWQSDDWEVSAAAGTRIVSYGQLLDTTTGTWLRVGRPESHLDHNLTATWAGDRLFVVGGVDEEVGFESPGGPEAWLWTPPAG
jgi:hypothetical protein